MNTIEYAYNYKSVLLYTAVHLVNFIKSITLPSFVISDVVPSTKA